MLTDARQNVITLLEQFVRLQHQKTSIETQLQHQSINLDNIDHIEKLEDELRFVISYSRTIIDQAIVMINENNVQDIPSIEELSRNITKDI